MVLRVKLEIVPFGDEDKAYEIGRLDIFNKGPVLAKDSGDNTTDMGGYHQYGVINLSPKDEGMYELDITHRRWEGAWKLVRKALEVYEIEGPK